MKNLSNAILPLLIPIFSLLLLTTLNAQGTGSTGGGAPNSNDEIETLKAIVTNEDTTCQAKAKAGLMLADILAKRIIDGTDNPTEANLKAISYYYFHAKWDYKCWLDEADDDLKACLKLYFELADLQKQYWEQMLTTLETIKKFKTNAGYTEAYEILTTDILPHLKELESIKTDAVIAIVKEAKKLVALQKKITDIQTKIADSECADKLNDDSDTDERPVNNSNNNSVNKTRENSFGIGVDAGILFNNKFSQMPFSRLKIVFPLKRKWSLSTSFAVGRSNKVESMYTKKSFGGAVSATGKGQVVELQQIQNHNVRKEASLQIHYLVFSANRWGIELYGGAGWNQIIQKQYNFEEEKTVVDHQNFVAFHTGAELNINISRHFGWNINAGYSPAKNNSTLYLGTGIQLRI